MREQFGDVGRIVGRQPEEYVSQIAADRPHPHLAKRPTSRAYIEATGKLGQPKQQFHA
jgi:hypothetical protein